MAQAKEFGVMKWVLTTVLAITFGGIVAWFNVAIFGYDGVPYLAAIAALVAISIVTTKYTGSHNKAVRTAAFCLEIGAFVILIVSVAYSISGLRELSLARQVGVEQGQTLKEIGNLKSRQGQLEAVRWMSAKNSTSKTIQAVFADYERPLFWLMILEAGWGVLTVFVLFGLSVLPDRDGNGIPDVFERKNEFPTEIEVPK